MSSAKHTSCAGAMLQSAQGIGDIKVTDTNRALCVPPKSTGGEAAQIIHGGEM